MTRYDIDIVGLDEAVAGISAIGTEGPAKVAGALYLEANDVFNESQRLVPVDTSTLKSSGGIEGPTITGGDIEVVVGYGGAASGYAIYVHEDLEKYHRPPTRAKFLEEPMLRAVPGMAGRIARRLFS